MKISDRLGSGSIKYDLVKMLFGVENDSVIPMWVADMDFETAPPIIKAIEKTLKETLPGYTYISTGDAVKGWQEKKGFKIESDWVIGLANVVIGIEFAVRAFTDIGDKIIVCSPVYGPFFSLVKDNDRKLIDAPLEAKDGKYDFNYDKFDPEAKMIFLCNPNNPTGDVWTREQLEKLAQYCIKNDIIVVSDEIHSDFIFNGKKHIPFASLSEEAADRTITVSAASKTFNLGGLTGAAYAIICDEEKRKKFFAQMERVKLFPSYLGCAALNSAYTECDQWHNELMTYIDKNRKFAKKYVDQKIPQLKAILGDATYLLWLDFSSLGIDSDNLQKLLLKEAHVALSPGNEFGRPHFFRMNLATDTKKIENALESISKLVFSLS
jgi:cystathionine beta-lyase